MKLLKLGVIALALTGCSAVEQSEKLSTNLEVKEYSSEHAKYMPFPSFTSIEQMSDGSTVLALSRDYYYGTVATPLRFSKSNAKSYAAFIDKYFDWAQLATSRGDAITKEIGKAETWKGASTDSLKFAFHSDGAEVYYLSISSCTVDMCFDDSALYFDQKNAQELKNLLLQAKTDTGVTETVDEIYK